MSAEEIKDEILKGIVENKQITESVLQEKYNSSNIFYYEYLTHLSEIESENLVYKDQYNFWRSRQEGRDFEGFVKRSKRLALESSKERSNKSWAIKLAIFSVILTVINISWGIGHTIYKNKTENSEIKLLNEKVELQDKKIDSLIDLSWRPSEKDEMDTSQMSK